MATTVITTFPERGIVKSEWLALGDAENGLSSSIARWADKTVTAQGTFGGATITIQVSNNDGTTWHTAQDMVGAALTFTAAGAKVMASNCLLMRAITTGGTGTTVSVQVCGRTEK